jgi:hypothetical protein
MRGFPFIIPNITPTVYDPGPQPNDPGQSVRLTRNSPLTVKPWPNAVPSLITLLSTGGIARARAPVSVVNNYSPDPSNYLFIGGFVGKSKG